MSQKHHIRKIALIMVGGKGTRLWPLSREEYPKQFFQFRGGSSLFQDNLLRLAGYFRAQDIFILAAEKYKFIIFNQIEALKGIKHSDRVALKRNLVSEPVAKNTAPAIMLGLKYLQDRRSMASGDTVFVFPSDNILNPAQKLYAALDHAQELAVKGKMVVFGIKPDHPSQGYGYITRGKKIGAGFVVDRFVEKPSLPEAKKLLRRKAFWNAGIFIFNCELFLRELAQYRPDIYRHYPGSYAKLEKNFSRVPAESMDYAVMQKTPHAAVIPLNLAWSDLGNWDSFAGFYSRKQNNTGVGKALFVDSNNCFAYSPERLVAVVGLDDVIVADSADSLLVVKKGKAAKVKDLVDKMKQQREAAVYNDTTVYRPWGYYTVLKEGKGYKVKKIGVYPGKALSLQKHKYRSEHWNVVEGRAQIIIGKKTVRLKRNESIFVPKGEKHKLYNPGKNILRIVEVQIGTYLGEDDIRRYDAYHFAHI